tara:strand:+ start:168 stop:887 length:720 start_codon:yes stop_codon:yes gene_type:complete
MKRNNVDFEIYKKIDNKFKPKELFKQVVNLLNIKEDKSLEQKKLIDIGGANGAFCYYLRTINDKISLTNIDFNDSILEESKDFLIKHNINFKKDDANSLSEKDSIYDYVTSFGVTQIFDDFIPSFSEMLRIASPGGLICNSIFVNEIGGDLIIKYIDPVSKKQLPGWNKFSLNSINNYLKTNKNVSNFEFIKHKMPFDLEKKDDKFRSYTKIINGERILWNDGLNMEVTIYSIVIKKID